MEKTMSPYMPAKKPVEGEIRYDKAGNAYKLEGGKPVRVDAAAPAEKPAPSVGAEKATESAQKATPPTADNRFPHAGYATIDSAIKAARGNPKVLAYLQSLSSGDLNARQRQEIENLSQ
jgi:hypothetical protein